LSVCHFYTMPYVEQECTIAPAADCCQCEITKRTRGRADSRRIRARRSLSVLGKSLDVFEHARHVFCMLFLDRENPFEHAARSMILAFQIADHLRIRLDDAGCFGRCLSPRHPVSFSDFCVHGQAMVTAASAAPARMSSLRRRGGLERVTLVSANGRGSQGCRCLYFYIILITLQRSLRLRGRQSCGM
jgi:hypothetical protein